MAETQHGAMWCPDSSLPPVKWVQSILPSLPTLHKYALGSQEPTSAYSYTSDAVSHGMSPCFILGINPILLAGYCCGPQAVN